MTNIRSWYPNDVVLAKDCLVLSVYTNRNLPIVQWNAVSNASPNAFYRTEVIYTNLAPPFYSNNLMQFSAFLTNSIIPDILYTNPVIDAPANLMASSGIYVDGVHLTWAPVYGATGYEIWWGLSGSTTATARLITTVTTNEYVDTGVTPGQASYYWVMAQNAACVCTSPFSVAAAGLRSGTPQVPELLTASCSDGLLSISCFSVAGLELIGSRAIPRISLPGPMRRVSRTCQASAACGPYSPTAPLPSKCSIGSSRGNELRRRFPKPSSAAASPYGISIPAAKCKPSAGTPAGVRARQRVQPGPNLAPVDYEWDDDRLDQRRMHFGGTLLGLALSKMLPGHHLSDESKDAVKMGAGMISMMAALVLGLLVSSAKSNFDATNAAITEGGANHPDGPPAGQLRPGNQGRPRRLAPGRHRAIECCGRKSPRRLAASAFERATADGEAAGEDPRAEAANRGQRVLQAQAQTLGHEILLTRWVQIEQAQVTLPPPFLVILLFWLTMLYTTFGLLAPRNATVITVMFLGAGAGHGDVPDRGDEPADGRSHQDFQRPDAQSLGACRPVGAPGWPVATGFLHPARTSWPVMPPSSLQLCHCAGMVIRGRDSRWPARRAEQHHQQREGALGLEVAVVDPEPPKWSSRAEARPV